MSQPKISQEGAHILIVPLFPHHLDPSAFTVVQEIVRSGAAENYSPEDVLLSIVYQFNNVSATTPPLSPDSATFSDTASRPSTAGSQFSSSSGVSLAHCNFMCSIY